MIDVPPYVIVPLGEQAVLVDFGNVIDEKINQHVLHLFRLLQARHDPGILDIIPAYSSLGVQFDPLRFDVSPSSSTAFELVADLIRSIINDPGTTTPVAPRRIEIPVCYGPPHGPDLPTIAGTTGLDPEEIIRLHSSRAYTVFMIGFLPGFAYLGTVDERIAVARHPQPRRLVAPGSVGIAGQQTGIYPLPSPGGWQLVGRTPLRLFNQQMDDPVLLHPGDQVTFFPISQDEFDRYQSRIA